MSETTQTTLAEFEKGDEIVFNDRKQPLTVKRVYDSDYSTRVYLKGPRGGSYELEVRRGEATVYRDDYDYEHKADWVPEGELESVELVTPAADVEPPVEVGDEFKEQTTLECVDYTGEWTGYRVVAIDREQQEVEVEVVGSPETADYASELSLHYHSVEDRLDGWTEVEDLATDDDVELDDQDDDQDDDPDSLIASSYSGPTGGRVELREGEQRDADNAHASVVERQLSMASEADLEAAKSMGERVGEGGNYGDPLGEDDRPVPAGVPDEPEDDQDDDDLATDGGYSAVEHFTAYVEGVVELDAVVSRDGAAALFRASRSALWDARDELQRRGYEAHVVEQSEHADHMVVIPDDDDLEAVLDALDDGVPEPGEGLEVVDPVDREDDDGEELVADGFGVTVEQDSAEWCGKCSRYRIDCAHMGEARADGGAVDGAKEPARDVGGMTWQDRAEKLEDETALKRRESEVQALKEQGLTHEKIADELGIGKKSVDEYSRRINQRIAEAEATLVDLGVVEDLEELDQDDAGEGSA